MQKSIFTSTFVVISLALTALGVITGCQEERKHPAIPLDSLRSGDIVFRRGMSIESEMVVLTNPGDALYSHIGLVVKKGDGWYIVHAVPNEPDYEGDYDRVKMEPVKSFFRGNKAVRGAVVRVDCSDSIANNVERHALDLCQRGTAFDEKYDLDDTTKLYCTELIDFLYRCEGIDLIEGRYTLLHLPVFPDTLIFPENILDSPLLTPVFSY